MINTPLKVLIMLVVSKIIPPNIRSAFNNIPDAKNNESAGIKSEMPVMWFPIEL